MYALQILVHVALLFLRCGSCTRFGRSLGSRLDAISCKDLLLFSLLFQSNVFLLLLLLSLFLRDPQQSFFLLLSLFLLYSFLLSSLLLFGLSGCFLLLALLLFLLLKDASCHSLGDTFPPFVFLASSSFFGGLLGFATCGGFSCGYNSLSRAFLFLSFLLRRSSASTPPKCSTAQRRSSKRGSSFWGLRCFGRTRGRSRR